jgi:hypothetical protein
MTSAYFNACVFLSPLRLGAPLTAFSSTSVKRGIRLLNGRKQVLLQDEVNASASVMWRMHTNATVNIDSSGTSATLTLDGQTLTVTMLSPPSGAQFTKGPAQRFDTDPIPPIPDQENPTVTVLMISLPAGACCVPFFCEAREWADGDDDRHVHDSGAVQPAVAGLSDLRDAADCGAGLVDAAESRQLGAARWIGFEIRGWHRLIRIRLYYQTHLLTVLTALFLYLARTLLDIPLCVVDLQLSVVIIPESECQSRQRFNLVSPLYATTSTSSNLRAF